MSKSSRSALARTEAAWLARFHQQGAKEFARGQEPSFDSLLLIQSVGKLIALAHDEPAIAARLAGRGLDAGFFACLTALAGELSAADKTEPADRRHIELLTPADHRTIGAAFAFYSLLRTAVGAAANAIDDLEQARQLGRGAKVHENAASLRDAIKLFLVAASSRTDLIEDAGIDAGQLSQLSAFVAQLDQILTAKGQRQLDKSDVTQAIALASLAIESALHLFRARANSGLGDDPAQLALALKRLPRKSERRTRGTKSGGGEGSGEGTGAQDETEEEIAQAK